MDDAFGHPQNIVVLGGTSDIARALTKKLCAARAHTVVLCGRSGPDLDRAAGEALDYGATVAETVVFDALDPASAAGAVTEAFAKTAGQVDLVIMAVGLLGVQETDQLDPLAVRRLLDVNLTWPMVALTEVRSQLLAQGRGRILVFSSVGAIRVRSTAYLYGGAKAGLDRMCFAMGESLAGTGVSLQLVRPGAVRTKMTTGLAPVPFMTGVNEVADNVMRGLSSGQTVIWSPPLLRYVYGVLRHLPGPLWRKIMDR